MSWPADLDETLLTTTLIGTTLELPSATPELVDALRHDREVLVRDALLWQQWVRYLALGAVAVLALVFGSDAPALMMPGIVLTSIGYLACVAISAQLIRRAEVVHEHRLPALLVWRCSRPLTMIGFVTGTWAIWGGFLRCCPRQTLRKSKVNGKSPFGISGGGVN